MRAWTSTELPILPGRGSRPLLHDTATDALLDPVEGDTAGLYVCGITPYDAAHLGHANTYLAFDTLVRVWRDAGVTVRYAQNTTDVDDPLLERAAATGVDWRELADAETEAFRRDLTALRILPPDAFVAVTERIAHIADAVARLLEDGTAYRLDDDVYFDTAAASGRGWWLGEVSRLERPGMLQLAAQRGGDPARPGKRDPLDPLLWRGAREGEPAWPTAVGAGRPGWHIECVVIAADEVGLPLAVQGGAHDLVFPHHEFGAGHAAALGSPLARAFVHAGLVAYEGEKMSKSLGNLVFVRSLLESGVEPAAVRLALLAHHYRADWEWTDADLTAATARLDGWRAAVQPGATREGDEKLLVGMRSALADDLNAPAAVQVIDEAADLAGLGPLAADAIDALLGIRLAPPATAG